MSKLHLPADGQIAPVRDPRYEWKEFTVRYCKSYGDYVVQGLSVDGEPDPERTCPLLDIPAALFGGVHFRGVSDPIRYWSSNREAFFQSGMLHLAAKPFASQYTPCAPGVPDKVRVRVPRDR